MTATSSRFPTEIPIRAGRFRFTVSIEEKKVEQSDTGAPIVSWVTFCKNIPAEILSGKGREMVAGGQEQSYLFTTVTIRTIPGVTTNMRVNHNGVFYNISAVLPDPSQQSYTELWCGTGLNLG